MMTPAALICNTDDHTRPGSHWVAIYIDKHRLGKYFDSYDFPPVSRHYLHQLRRNYKTFRWNVKTLQSIDSICCGQYTIMFLYYMYRSIGLVNFCRLFTRDTRKNDALDINYYKKFLRKISIENVRMHSLFQASALMMKAYVINPVFLDKGVTNKQYLTVKRVSVFFITFSFSNGFSNLLLFQWFFKLFPFPTVFQTFSFSNGFSNLFLFQRFFKSFPFPTVFRHRGLIRCSILK